MLVLKLFAVLAGRWDAHMDIDNVLFERTRCHASSTGARCEVHKARPGYPVPGKTRRVSPRHVLTIAKHAGGAPVEKGPFLGSLA